MQTVECLNCGSKVLEEIPPSECNNCNKEIQLLIGESARFEEISGPLEIDAIELETMLTVEN